MKVNELPDNESEIEWTMLFDVAEEQEAEMQEMIKGLYLQGIEGIAQLHRSVA